LDILFLAYRGWTEVAAKPHAGGASAIELQSAGGASVPASRNPIFESQSHYSWKADSPASVRTTATLIAELVSARPVKNVEFFRSNDKKVPEEDRKDEA
jgi:hypothetical protein